MAEPAPPRLAGTEDIRRRHRMKREALGLPPWPGPGPSWQPPLAPKQTQAEQIFTLLYLFNQTFRKLW